MGRGLATGDRHMCRKCREGCRCMTYRHALLSPHGRATLPQQQRQNCQPVRLQGHAMCLAWSRSASQQHDSDWERSADGWRRRAARTACAEPLRQLRRRHLRAAAQPVRRRFSPPAAAQSLRPRTPSEGRGMHAVADRLVVDRLQSTGCSRDRCTMSVAGQQRPTAHDVLNGARIGLAMDMEWLTGVRASGASGNAWRRVVEPRTGRARVDALLMC